MIRNSMTRRSSPVSWVGEAVGNTKCSLSFFGVDKEEIQSRELLSIACGAGGETSRLHELLIRSFMC